MKIDLNTTAVELTPQDPLTIRQMFESLCLFGGTGSGKSTLLAVIIRAMLQLQFGMVFTTTKPEDKQDYIELIKESGREDQLVIFSPKDRYFFDALEQQAKLEDGSDTFSLVALLMIMVEVANGGSVKGKEPYWELSMRQMITNAIDLLKAASELITIQNIYRLIISAPTSVRQLDSKEWRAKSYCFACLSKASDQSDSFLPDDALEMHFEDFPVTFDYWRNEFPNLSEKTRSIVVSMFTTTANSFIRGYLKKLFIHNAKGIATPPDILRSGALIILDLPTKKYSVLGKLAQSLFTMMTMSTMERMPLSHYPRPVSIVSDEAYQFLSSFHVDNQATLRSSGTCCVYAGQSISSYQIGLGEQAEAKVHNLLSNISTKFFLANTDIATNDYAAKLFGEIWSRQSSSSTSIDADNDPKMSASISDQKRHIIEPLFFSNNLLRGGPQDGNTVSALVHQIGRTWSTGNNFLEVFYQR